MSAFQQKNPLINQEAFPVFFSSKTFQIQSLSSNAHFEKFELFQMNFGNLASSCILDEIRSSLMEIDIIDEINLMQKESALEITIPILGVVDLLHHLRFVGFKPHMACILGLNGYSAKNQSELNNFPKADFIVATDIIGNKYEILVDRDGKIQLPEEGIGIFSIITSLTFIYSEQQVKEGLGLQASPRETDKNKLLILPATETSESYVITVCITHLNSFRQRVVDSIRHIYVRHQRQAPENITKNVQIKQFDANLPNTLRVDVAIGLVNDFSAKPPFAVNITLQPLKEVEYNFIDPQDLSKTNPIHGYVRHPIFSNVYTKYVGLSEKGFLCLLEQIYSEYDFIKDYLHEVDLTFSHHNGYNNFLLRTEAFKALHNLLIHCLVNHEIPGQFLMKRIPEERLLAIELPALNLDFHDTMVIWQLREEIAHGYFEKFRRLFYCENDENLQDVFYIHAKGMNDIVPKATIEILNQQNFTKNILSYVDRASFEEHFQNISSKALRQSCFDLPEFETLSFQNSNAIIKQDQTLLGIMAYKTLHLNEVADFSSLMTTKETLPAYWIEFGKTPDKKAYAFYTQNTFEKDSKLRMNVTQTKPIRSYQMATWVDNSSVMIGSVEMTQVLPKRHD